MQNLNIGKIIKKLRINKNITQDDLAEFLGVSTPAISKWENSITYPDIALLPVLANYFNVSIDEIMDYKPNLTDKEIDSLINKCEKLISEDITKAIELFEAYLKQCSSSPKFKIRLSEISLLIYSKIKDENKIISLNKRLISTLIDTVDTTTDMELKEKTLIQLSGHYMFNKDYKNAKECLEKIYKPSQNPDLILPNIFILQKEFDEGRRRLQKSLKNSLEEATSFSWQLGASYLQKDSLDIDRAIEYFTMAIKIRESEGNLLNIGLPYVYLSYCHKQKYNDKTSINDLNELIRKMSLFKPSDIDKYYDLIDKNEDEFNTSARFKGVLALIKSLFSDDDILESEDFKILIESIKNNIKSN